MEEKIVTLIYLAKEFNETELDNIHFLKIDNIKEFVLKYEKQKDLKKPNQKDLEWFEKQIKLNKRHFFFTKKNVYENKETKTFK